MLATVDRPGRTSTLPTLQVKLLGDFCLTYQDEPLTSVNTERMQALLTYLILHRDAPQPRQRLAFLFWPDSSDAQARTNLRRELHHLRRVLPDADRFIEADTKSLQWRLDGPFSLDVAAFEQAVTQAEAAERAGDRTAMQIALEQAASLYQGKLLPTCYDEWIEPEQERLQQVCARALTQLMDLLKSQTDYRGAIAYAHQLLRLDSFNETTYRSLMELYGLNGDRAGALRIYQQCAKVLEQELGVDPDPSTQALYERLLLADTGANTAGATTPIKSPSIQVPAAVSGAIAKPSSTGQSKLIGRQAEVITLQTWLQSSGDLLWLMGEAGIGKTRLLEELAATVCAAKGQVLWGRGFEAEMLRPYGAWIDALRSVTLNDVANLPAELGVLLPEIGTIATKPDDRSRLFDAVVQLLTQLTANGTPLLILLDDVQWLDEASTALLHYATRLLKHAPVRFACAARPQVLDRNQAVLKFLQAIRREQRVQCLDLSPLDVTQTAELVRSVSADLDGERIFADSGGNPLFTLEIARAFVQDETTHFDNLEALIQERLQQLDSLARELLPWAAALGRSFNPTILARVADSSLLKLLTAMEELERQGIIRPGTAMQGEVGYDFAHDLVRQIAYDQLSSPRRRIVHLHIAQVLQELSQQDEGLAGEVAHHASLGGDRELAATACLTAANRGLRLFAYTEAAQLAQRGIHHCQHLDARSRIRLHIQLLKIQILSGVPRSQGAAIEADLMQLLQEARVQGYKDEEGSGLEALLYLNFDHGNFSNVHQHSLQVAEQVRKTSPSVRVGLLATSGSCLAEIGREIEKAEALLLEAQALAERTGLELIDIPCGLGCVRLHDADYEEARRLLQQAWQIARAGQEHWRESSCLVYLIMTELESGYPAAALTYCEELATVAAKISGEASETTFAIALQALAQYRLNSPEAAIALERAIAQLRQIDAKRMLSYVLSFAAELDLEQSRFELAIARAEEALHAAQVLEHPSEIAIAAAVLIRGLLALDADECAIGQFRILQYEVSDRTLSNRARQMIVDLQAHLPAIAA